MNGRRTLIVNASGVVTGNLASPVADANAVLIADGTIQAVGDQFDLGAEDADVIVDVGGMWLTPGLIDPHVHAMPGDWTPRQQALGWMESALHGGVTSMVSLGAFHLPSLPDRAVAAKAVAVQEAMIFQSFRPGGALKVLAGAVVLVPDLSEDDFAEMAAGGVRLVAEVGVRGLYKPDEVHELLKWARARGMKVPVHCGPPSISGCAKMTADIVLALEPDVAAHVNGGPLAPTDDDIDCLIAREDLLLEVVYTGNPRAMHRIVTELAERGQLRRLHIGSDTPCGAGVIPLSILRCVAQISALNGLKAPEVLALATGNAAKAYGLPQGRVEPGCPADILALGRPIDSPHPDALSCIESGDNPAIGMIMVDGKVIATHGRNTPAPHTRVQFRGS